jgi:hypothetical protein
MNILQTPIITLWRFVHKWRNNLIELIVTGWNWLRLLSVLFPFVGDFFP